MAESATRRYYFRKNKFKPLRTARHQSEMEALFVVLYVAALAAQLDLKPDAPDTERAPILETAKRRYYDAVEGQRGALEESRELLSEARSQSPADPLILAYSGSVLLLEAARTPAIWRKGKLAREGLQMLDQAVSDSPEDEEIPFLRAVSSFHLPRFFKRRDQSQADFTWLAPRVASAVASGRLDKRLGAAALYHYGVVLERSHDQAGAKAAWREAARLGPGTRAGDDARKELEGLPE